MFDTSIALNCFCVKPYIQTLKFSTSNMFLCTPVFIVSVKLYKKIYLFARTSTFQFEVNLLDHAQTQWYVMFDIYVR